VLNYDLGTSSDSVTVNRQPELGGTLNITDAGGFTTGNYTLFTYAGTLSASGTLTVGATPNASLTYTINTNTTGSGGPASNRRSEPVQHLANSLQPQWRECAGHGRSGRRLA